MSEAKLSTTAIIISMISAVLVIMVTINGFFIRNWMEQTEKSQAEVRIQLSEIRQEIKRLELTLAVMNASLVTREEVKAIASDMARSVVSDEVRKHEKECHTAK